MKLTINKRTLTCDLKKSIQSKISSKIGRFLGIATLSILAIGCKSSQVSYQETLTPPEVVTRGFEEISVMTFNVENMFDNVDDEGVNDETYLPLSEKNKPEVIAACKKQSNPYYKSECLNKNWDDQTVNFKLSQVAKVISYVDNGEGPDNLFLAEVENENILNKLVKEHMSNLGYKTVVILKGPDTRGINTAFISKFPMVGKPQLHIIPYTDPGAKKSRGILEVTVNIKGKNVTFLSAHFPSQSNPTAQRKEAHEFLRNLMLDMQKQGRLVIAGGDLNTIPEEDQKYGYFSKVLSAAGQVSNLVGCKSCEGTHFYKGEWSFLDVMIYGSNLASNGITLIPGSIEVVKAPVQSKANGTPIRFDEEKREGVSDHFPLYSRLKVQ